MCWEVFGSIGVGDRLITADLFRYCLFAGDLWFIFLLYWCWCVCVFCVFVLSVCVFVCVLLVCVCCLGVCVCVCVFVCVVGVSVLGVFQSVMNLPHLFRFFVLSLCFH